MQCILNQGCCVCVSVWPDITILTCVLRHNSDGLGDIFFCCHRCSFVRWQSRTNWQMSFFLRAAAGDCRWYGIENEISHDLIDDVWCSRVDKEAVSCIRFRLVHSPSPHRELCETASEWQTKVNVRFLADSFACISYFQSVFWCAHHGGKGNFGRRHSNDSSIFEICGASILGRTAWRVVTDPVWCATWKTTSTVV